MLHTASTRIEHDLLGDRAVPADAYYGVHTLRAVENFAVSGVTIGAYPHLITALCRIKQAAAKANCELGLLDPVRAEVIGKACDELIAGSLRGQFVVDAIQGGAGTSTNMNVNEVIANVGLELLGAQRGQYSELHPNEHVNMSQSTNDVYPSAVKLALHAYTQELAAELVLLQQAFAEKGEAFKTILKMGRTQLQDAVPMTLGQEFNTYAGMLAREIAGLRAATAPLLELNLGGTAIGTGINCHPAYASKVCRHLSEITGQPITGAADLIEATQDTGAFVDLSGRLRQTAIKLSKICNDLRLLASGPRVGLAEINLPPRQAGSSIMPGKVNPVIPELVNQVAFEIIGNDVTVGLAAEAGQLQLNAFEPIIAYSLFKGLVHLRAACEALREHCIEGITANSEHLRNGLAASVGIVTALNPYIGYRHATSVARDALASGRSVYELVLERGLLTQAQLDAVLQPSALTTPHLIEDIDGLAAA